MRRVLQVTGRYGEALVVREGLAKDEPGIETLASLLAEMGRWAHATIAQPPGQGAAQRASSFADAGGRHMTLALAGLVAGFVHVLSGPDHLAAIAPCAATRKARAWRTGVRWGVGHSAGVLGVGLLALLARHALPLDALSAWPNVA